MFNIVSYWWRLVATGFCFSMFGFGGLLLSFIIFPCQKLVIRNSEQQKQVARKTVHYSFRLFVRLMTSFGVLGLDLSKAKSLNNINGQLVIANHPSLIDVVVLISIIPNADCVVKAHLFRNPFLRGVVRSTGYISNNDPIELIKECAQSLSAGNNLIIFPEGTRTEPGNPVKFQRGAANIAVRCRADITAVNIDLTPTTLTKQDSWYNIPERRAVFSAEVVGNVPKLPELESSKINKQVRQYSQILESYFNRVVNIK